MVETSSDDAEYEKFKNLLKFFYAQYRYNKEAKGLGGVGKLPKRNKKSQVLYPIDDHLAKFGLTDFLQGNPQQIGPMYFVIRLGGVSGYMGSDPNTYISLGGTGIGLYLHQDPVQGEVGATIKRPFEDFFTWDNPDIDPKTLYVGEYTGDTTDYNKYGSYQFADLGLGTEGLITGQLKELFHKLQKFDAEAKANRQEQREESKGTITRPYNWILFGAPGTGKSYALNTELEKIASNNVRRITMYPDYTYGQFVGTYKPTVTDDHKISYEFVPGPFTLSLVESLKDPNNPHVLVIEEINRADPASIFGDIFQLLDREHGVSEYPITVNEDLKKYLNKELKGPGEATLNKLLQLDDGTPHEDSLRIVIPSNLYLWATMNSADQGVFPMDTAFKRRWSFTYMPLDGSKDENDDTLNPEIWEEARQGINRLLKESNTDIPEDKLLGKFFLSDDDLEDRTTFTNTFKSKVLMYLFEDAAKYCRDQIFEIGDHTGTLYLSDLFDNLTNSSNLGIFREEILKNKSSSDTNTDDASISQNAASDNGQSTNE